MGLVSYFNEKYHDFKDIFFNPQVGAKKIVRKSNLAMGAKQLAVFGFLTGMLGVFLLSFAWIVGSLVGVAAGKSLSGVFSAFIQSVVSIAAFVILFIPFYFVALLLTLVWVGVIWGIAKLLGGKPDFSTHFGAMSFVCIIFLFISTFAWGVVYTLSAIIAPFSTSIAGIFGWLALAPALLMVFYCIWLYTIITAETHQIERWKAAVAVIVPTFAAAIFAVMVAVIIIYFMSAFHLLPALKLF